MSLEAFKKEVWEPALLTEFEGVLLTEAVTTSPSTVEGKTAHFSVLSDVTVSDYVIGSEINFEDSGAVGIDLNYDKMKSYSFKVDKVENAQLAGDILLTGTKDAVYKMKKQIDKDVFTEMAKNTKNVIGTAGAKKQITSCDEAYDYIVDLNTMLDENDIPEYDRFIIASPSFVNLLAKDKRVIDNTEALENGVTGIRINGSVVCKSNNVPKNTVLAVHKSAVGFGKLLSHFKSGECEKTFADYVAGLTVYGAVILRDNAIAKLLYEIA